MPSEPGTPIGAKRPMSKGTQDGADAEPSPAPKRQRVSRACDQCRAAREKCDGIQPLCFPCASQNRQCSWQEPKKKRGVQTGYIRTLELALGWIFDKIPGSEEALHGLLTHEGGQGRTLLVGKDTGAGNRLHRRWTKSTVHKEIDRVLSGGELACTKAEKPSPALEDLDSDDETEQTEKLAISVQATISTQGDAESNSLARGERSPETWRERQDLAGHSGAPQSTEHGQPPRYGPDQLECKTVRLPSNSWRLLDIYFSYTHCWFPVLEKALVQKTCWSYPNEGMEFSIQSPAAASHAELWAVFALASVQEAASQGSGSQHNLDGHMSPETIYQTARSLLPSETGSLESGHVNALLLLALVNIGREAITPAWILIGAATRIALSLGLHLPSAAESYRRPHHAFVGCFILDTLVASRLHRPPHLRSDDVQLMIPSGEDDRDEWDRWTPCQGFGDQQSQLTASRSPSHSITSFNSLYGIHKAHCRDVFSASDHSRPQADSYQMQVRQVLSTNNRLQAVSAYVINGGIPPAQLPSIYLLRLSFLCCGIHPRDYPNYLRSSVLQCLEEYIFNFGACGIPPLFSMYISLVAPRHDDLSVEDRDRWKKVEAAIHSVWAPPRSSSEVNSIIPPGPTVAYSQPSSHLLYQSTGKPNVPIQQIPTPSSYYSDTPTDQPRTAIGGDVYHDTSASGMMDYPSSSRSRPSMDLMSQLGSTASINRGFDLPDIPPQHYSMLSRPSFGSAAFDYDAILDDIASLNRTDGLESDSQFMANLGFAPGSSLAEVLTHEFTGIS